MKTGGSAGEVSRSPRWPRFSLPCLRLRLLQPCCPLDRDIQCEAELQDWLVGTGYNVVSVQVANNSVNAAIEGTGGIRPVDELAGQLATSFGHPVIVRLHLIQAEILRSSAP